MINLKLRFKKKNQNTTSVLQLPVLVYCENLRRLLLDRCKMSFETKTVIENRLNMLDFLRRLFG